MLIKTPADLGALIRERRTALRLDQESLAKSIGVSRKWVVEVEAGKPRAAMELIFRALRALGITLQAATSGSANIQKKKKAQHDLPSDDLDRFLDSLKKRNG